MSTRRDRDKERKRRGRGGRESTNKRLDEKGKGFDSSTIQLPQGVSFFNFKDAKPKTLDILKYKVGKGNPFADEGLFHWERTFYVHKNIGSDNRAYVCPQMESGGEHHWYGAATGGKNKCPICEHIIPLSEDYQENKDLIKSIRLQERQLFNVKLAKERRSEIMVLDIATWSFGRLIDAELTTDRDEGDDEYQDFSEWSSKKGGLSIRVTIEKSVYNRRDQFKPISVSFKKRTHEYKNLEDKLHCLDSLIKVPEYKELKEVFLQVDEDTKSQTGKKKFRRKDMQKIKEMSDKQLMRFVIVNDMEVDPDDFEDDVDGLREAITKEVQASLKGTSKSGNGKGKDEDEDEIEVGSTVEWTDEDGDDMKGTVLEIKGKTKKKAMVEDKDGEEFTVPLKDLTLVDDDNGDDDEIEEGSDVTWTDDDDEEHEGEVIEIKGKKATVKEGRKKYKVALKDLTLA